MRPRTLLAPLLLAILCAACADDSTVALSGETLTIQYGAEEGSASEPVDYPRRIRASEGILRATLAATSPADPFVMDVHGVRREYERETVTLRPLEELKAVAEDHGREIDIDVTTNHCAISATDVDPPYECEPALAVTYDVGREVVVLLRIDEAGWGVRQMLPIVGGLVHFPYGRAPVTVEAFRGEVAAALGG